MKHGEDHRLRRLRLRSWRRGTREMDLILGPFSDAELDRLTAAELDTYESFLAEADQDLYSWVSGRADPPPGYAALVERLRARHAVRESDSSAT